MKKLFSLLLVAAFIFCSFSVVSAKEVEDTREGYGMNISNFSARILKTQENLTGDVIDDYDLTFINYWATWCGPCVGEMPHIKQMYEYYEATPELDVNVIGAVSISGSCTEDSAYNFLTSNGYEWTNVIPDSVLNSVFSTSGYIPQTLIVDRNGIVRDHIVGSFPSYNELLEYVEMWLDVLRNHDGEDCTVTYVNEITGEIIRQDVVPVGSIVPDAPAAPTIEGYTFANWVYDDNMLETGYPTVYHIAMGDTTVTAHYNIKKYLVRFYDSFNNSILSTQQVEHGHAATPPADPDHTADGLIFIGWDTDFSCITQITYIYSMYRKLGDLDGDGNVNVMEALTIMRAAMNLVELDDITYADINCNGSVEVSDAVVALRIAMGIS